MQQNLIKFEEYSKRNELEPIDLQQWMDKTHKLLSIDVASTPCDDNLLSRFDLLSCCKHCVVPWQKLGTVYVILCESEASKQEFLKSNPEHKDDIVSAYASLEDIDAELRRMGGQALIKNAHETCPPKNSVRTLALSSGRAIAVGTLSFLAVCAYLLPMTLLITLTLFATMFILGNSILRLVALIHISKDKQTIVESKALNIHPPKDGWPSISVLIPLYRESEVLHSLLENLISIDYPKFKLDIKLLIEADDELTSNALDIFELPYYFDIVRVPPDTLRTKPKAMNYALPFCRSDIIGIYDAEDKPDVMQLRKVAHEFATAPKNAACIQCELDFFNTRQNWFTRCFTIEYRIWFATVLPIVQKLGMAVPLGGTSVFVKRDALEEIGAWDAHNVTEDADLGIRLKRNGYETLVLRSRTMEEANSKGISWIRQRSRWLKGYMVTWLCHMRSPSTLLKDLGWVGFLGFHIMFMGAIVNYLSLPLFWIMWLSVFGIDPFNLAALPLFFSSLFFSIMLFAQVVNISLAYMGLRKNDNTRDLFKWYLTMPLYWPLGAMAAYKATIELVIAPYYWDKTQHGHARAPKHQ